MFPNHYKKYENMKRLPPSLDYKANHWEENSYQAGATIKCLISSRNEQSPLYTDASWFWNSLVLSLKSLLTVRHCSSAAINRLDIISESINSMSYDMRDKQLFQYCECIRFAPSCKFTITICTDRVASARNVDLWFVSRCTCTFMICTELKVYIYDLHRVAHKDKKFLIP